jgi:hypothetical protein
MPFRIAGKAINAGADHPVRYLPGTSLFRQSRFPEAGRARYNNPTLPQIAFRCRGRIG